MKERLTLNWGLKLDSKQRCLRGRRRTALVAAVLFGLAACTRAEFGGHAFVVKGGGDVKPAAGERVYLLPYADTAELRSALLQEMAASQFAEVGPKMTESCNAAAAALEAELQKNEAERQTLKSSGDVS